LNSKAFYPPLELGEYIPEGIAQGLQGFYNLERIPDRVVDQEAARRVLIQEIQTPS